MIYWRPVINVMNILFVKQQLWQSLLGHLCDQGKGIQESGAFLLGSINGNQRMIRSFLPYERLQADALHRDYVSLNSDSFSKLWALCREHNVSVVGDVHTHRFGPQQSRSDRANPMIARKGHMAIIVPRFAHGKIESREVGLHCYQGAHKWVSVFHSDVGQYLKIER